MSAKWLMCAALIVAIGACGRGQPTGDGGGGGTAGGTGGGTAGGSGGGSGGGTGGGSAGGVGGGSGGGGAGGAGGGAACSPSCGTARACCSGTCVNLANDPHHCGACGTTCSGTTPYCDGTCQPTPCSLGGTACDGGSCCGSNCCNANQLCCLVEGPLSGPPSCFTPTASQTTCPQGCAPLCISDREIKRQIVPADEQAVLEAVAQMPISTWSYQTEDSSVRHLGPMAQDFHAAFGLGNTELAYDPVDAHGVELAAIKALNARIRQLEEQNQRLEARLKHLEKPVRLRR